MDKVKYHSISFGCDPEMLFRDKDGFIVGAETVLPEEGFKIDTKDALIGGGTSIGGGESKIIIDGVQAELNPRPNTVREHLANEIAWCLRKLHEQRLIEQGISVDFSQSVMLSEAELDKISDKYKKFGCNPSRNVYVEGGISKIEVNPLVYRGRSMGGHLHLGIPPFADAETEAALKSPHRLVPLLDLIVGNTAVLIDRDTSNIERRKVYGKAGEHRTPKHGLEYRTPSNFWLKDARLLGVMTGLARLAVVIAANSIKDGEIEKLLFSKVRMREVVDAINNNDIELAKHNFKAIEEILLGLVPDNDEYPIHSGIIAEFHHFVNKGSEHWFKDSPMEHWIGITDNGAPSFEQFLKTTVRSDLRSQ